MGQAGEEVEVGADLAGGIEGGAGVSAGFRREVRASGGGRGEQGCKCGEKCGALIARNYPAGFAGDETFADALSGVGDGG
jgi:hypothetical protein